MLVVSERWGGPAFVRPTYKGFFWYKAAAAGVAAAGRGLVACVHNLRQWSTTCSPSKAIDIAKQIGTKV